ncbi:MAG: SAM-dependent methyltransferase [Solirubrobacteraceae bacterium]
MRLPRERFEALYEADPDPWGFESEPYEREKYARTMQALGDRTYPCGFEAGCSIGVLTSALATRCDELLAVDIAQRAVDAARKRLADAPHVRIERSELPEDWPAGPFDLVVCSEVLYYLAPETLRAALPAMRASVAPGGRMIAVHFRPPSSVDPMTGDDVHAMLRAELGLAHVEGTAEDRYLLDVFGA